MINLRSKDEKVDFLVKFYIENCDRSHISEENIEKEYRKLFEDYDDHRLNDYINALLPEIRDAQIDDLLGD